jgi:hypothetical protein
MESRSFAGMYNLKASYAIAVESRTDTYHPQLRQHRLHRLRQRLHRRGYRLRPALRNVRRPLGARSRARRPLRNHLTSSAQRRGQRRPLRLGSTRVHHREGQGHQEAVEGQARLDGHMAVLIQDQIQVGGAAHLTNYHAQIVRRHMSHGREQKLGCIIERRAWSEARQYSCNSPAGSSDKAK